MEFIKPTVEIWEQSFEKASLLPSLWSHIARCVRVCYQSEDKKNPSETDEAFVKRVILRKEPWNSEANHLAMLEHGTVYLKGINDLSEKILVSHYINDKYSKLNISYDYEKDIVNCFVTTNLRVLVEHDWLDDLKYICVPTKHHPERVTVCFNTSIDISREFNRHRVNSIAEESTRYCNYCKNGEGNLKIALPDWISDETFDSIPATATHFAVQIIDGNYRYWKPIGFYLCSLIIAEWCYNNLIRLGWKPQQARKVLPLTTKTQLIHTAFVEDWEHFIKLRADGISGTSHPDAKYLASILKDLLKSQTYK